MNDRGRIAGVGQLLRLKHEMDLQALADARRAEAALRAQLDEITAELAARAAADDLSATTGNDAVWAARSVRRQRELAARLPELAEATRVLRYAAEQSFGRIEAFRGLVSRRN